MKQSSLSSLTFVAIQAAFKAGNILRTGFGTAFEVFEKTNPQDLVTALDRASEEAIINFIREYFPDHHVLAEESGASSEHDKGVSWIIDPLDGTMNFVHSIPIFAISIAAYAENDIQVAVIYQPMTHELFVAEKNKGAYLNGSRLRVTATEDILKAIVATYFPYELDEACLSYFQQLLRIGSPVRVLGSAALNLAYVASGRFDVYCGVNLSPWDIAAGKLLVEEAGGKITQYDGSAHPIFSNSSIAATNSLLHEQVLSKLIKFPPI